MNHNTLLALLLGLASAPSLHAKWQRVPTSENKPIEIGATGMRSQGSIVSSTGLGKAESLLSVDKTDPVSVAAGNSNAVISLGTLTMLNRSSFTSDGIEGRATLSASADNKSWAVLDEKVFTSADRDIVFAFAGIQAKFIKLEFALSKGGTIRNFQMYGGASDKDYTVNQGVSEEKKKGYPVNFAGVGGSRLIYASPTLQNSMDEAISYNKFEFPESDDRYRTLIYDLGQLRFLDSFGSVHSPRPVRFEVFTFNQLPEKEDWRGRLAFNPSDFNVREPIAAAEDTRGLGFLKAKPAKLVAARYVAMRWEPDFNPPAFNVSAPLFTGNSSYNSQTISAALATAGFTQTQIDSIMAQISLQSGETGFTPITVDDDSGNRATINLQQPLQGSPSANGIGISATVQSAP